MYKKAISRYNENFKNKESRTFKVFMNIYINIRYRYKVDNRLKMIGGGIINV